MSSDAMSSPFSVLGQYLRDLSFENLFTSAKAGKISGELQSTTEHEVNLNPLNQEERIYEVELVVKVEANESQNKLFIVEVKYVAVVQLHPAVDKEHFQMILGIEIPFYLFFQVSNMIAHMTHLGGYPPLFLRPIDFTDGDDDDSE